MQKLIDKIIHKIFVYEKKRKFFEFLSYVLNTLILFLSFLFIASFFELTFHSSQLLRKIEFYSLVIIPTGYLIAKTFLLLVKRRSVELIAEEIGYKISGIKDRLKNVLEIYFNQKGDNNLISESINQIYIETKEINFAQTINISKIKNKIIVFTITLITVLAVQVNLDFNNASKSILFYNLVLNNRFQPDLKIIPGNTRILKEDELQIEVVTSDIIDSKMILNYRSENSQKWNQKNLTKIQKNKYSVKLAKLKRDMSYFISIKDYTSDVYKVEVLNYPKVINLELEIKSPSYTKLKEVYQIDNGNISAIKGSEVVFKIESSKELDSAFILCPSLNYPLKKNNIEAKGSLRLTEQKSYYINLIDTDQIQNNNPINYQIVIEQDEYPKIELLKPKGDIELGRKNSVGFELKLADDFGFTQLQLEYRYTKSIINKVSKKFRTINLNISKNEKIQLKNFNWDVDSLRLIAGDELECFFVISDNDFVSGPKKTETKKIKIKVPTIDEVLSSSNKSFSNTNNELENYSEELKKLNEEFQKLKNELKRKDQKISFNEKEKIQENLKKFNSLIKKLDQTKKEITKNKSRLEKNNLLSENTLKKYKELQKLFDELGNEKISEAFKKMNDLLSQMDRKKIQNELKNIEFNEKQFEKSIERTINLLKRLQLEQHIENIKNRINDIAITQEKNIKKENQNLLLQEMVSEKINSLEKEINSAEKTISDISNAPKKKFREIQKLFSSQKNTQTSKEAEENIKRSQDEKALKKELQISDNMEKLNEEISKFQSQMEQKNNLEIVFGLYRVFNGLIELSELQELLKGKIAEGKYNSSAKEENLINEKLTKIYNQVNVLSQKTFLITPELGRYLGMSRRNILSSINNLSDGNKNKAVQSTNQVISSLNTSALIIKKLIEMMMQGNSGSSGGGMSMMQQLKQMGQEQMSLNQITEKMLSGKKLSSEQASQLQRIAQQQEVIRNSLEELNKKNIESGKSKSLTQDLEKIVKEMNEVISKLQTGTIDTNIKNQQNKILSRLLEAQKSISDRDYEKLRKSVSGESKRRLSPKDIKLNKNNISKELLESLKDNYSKDYEELIKRYFEKIKKTQKVN